VRAAAGGGRGPSGAGAVIAMTSGCMPKRRTARSRRPRRPWSVFTQPRGSDVGDAAGAPVAAVGAQRRVADEHDDGARSTANMPNAIVQPALWYLPMHPSSLAVCD